MWLVSFLMKFRWAVILYDSIYFVCNYNLMPAEISGMFVQLRLKGTPSVNIMKGLFGIVFCLYIPFYTSNLQNELRGQKKSFYNSSRT